MKQVKQRKCDNCKKLFTPRNSFHVYCDTNCALIGMKDKKPKVIKLLAKADREATREQKRSNMTYTQRVNEIKLIFQAWVRNRDANDACISCGSTTAEIWDGGHYKKAELYRGLIFNELNVNKQCRKCNSYLGGNEANYRAGLVAKIGIELVEELEQLANETRNKKWSNEELAEIKNKYK
jgi:hypothetical protein